MEGGILSIKPAIDPAWKEYAVRYEFGSSVYNIKVKNPNGKSTGVEKFFLNGEEIEEKRVKLMDNGKVNEIEVEM